jgi:hypothetical protein
MSPAQTKRVQSQAICKSQEIDWHKDPRRVIEGQPAAWYQVVRQAINCLL